MIIKRADWLAISKDRTAIILFIVAILLIIVVVATTLLRVQISDVQIPVRYTGYGLTHIYRDHWYTQYSFVGFAVIIMTINTVLALKIYSLRRMLAMGLLSLTIMVLCITLIISNAIFNLTPSV